MAVFIVLTREERALERAGDMALRALPPDLERPAYTERLLARRSRRLISMDALIENAATAPEPLRDELRFLASISRLEPKSRCCLILWIDGWTQREIAAALRVSQQSVSQWLRRALRACYDMSPLSFRRFSQRSIYRPPRRRRGPATLRRCAFCKGEFPPGSTGGRYCSTYCRQAAAHANNYTNRG